MTPHSVAAVVLAAGRSSRMGEPKPFLEFAESTFIETAVSRLREAGLGRIVVIANPDHIERHEKLRVRPDAVVPNYNIDEGMMASLRLGIEQVGEGASHLLMTLADMPAIMPETHRAAALAALENPGRICIVEYRGRRGHPVVFPSSLFGELAEWKGEGGARVFLDEREELVVRIPVDDPAVRIDADRPEDLPGLRALEN